MAAQDIFSGKALAGALLGALVLAHSAPADAVSPFLVVPDPAVAEQSPSYRYANMTDAEAFAELDRRKVVYSRLGAVAGVRAPVRITGRLHGVYIHSSLPPEERVSSAFEILDARLALALDDFTAILERHDIDEVIHFTMYRPNGPAPDGVHEHDEQAAPALARQKRGRTASTARKGAGQAQSSAPAADRKTWLDRTKVRERPKGLKQKPAPPKQRAATTGPRAARREATAVKPVTGTRVSYAPPGTRHPAGLAIDVGGLRKKDGKWLSVGFHFQGHIGDRTCGEGARVPEQSEARELRSIVCEVADLGVFTYVLTPNYNLAHADHYHMEIKPGVHWFLYH